MFSVRARYLLLEYSVVNISRLICSSAVIGYLVIGIILANVAIGANLASAKEDTKLITESLKLADGIAHGASIVEVENDDLLLSWFAGSKEVSKDSQIYGMIKSKKSNSWQSPFVIIDKNYSKSVGNTALYKDDEGVIWLFFSSLFFGGWSLSQVDYIQSFDNGKSWIEAKKLIRQPGNLPRNRPIRLEKNLMLLPLYNGLWNDVGLSGSYVAKIRHENGKILSTKYTSLSNHNMIQPAVVATDEKDIVLFGRDKQKRNVLMAHSEDIGDSWSNPIPTSLPNPDSAIAAIYVEEIDAILIGYNDSRIDRTVLSLAVSFDGGTNFIKIYDLEKKVDDKNASFAYPSIIRDSKKIFHIVWTSRESTNGATKIRNGLKYAQFPIDWLKLKIEAAKSKQNGY